MVYFLGIDAGQTVVKAVLFDDQLQQVELARGQSPTESPEPRHVQRSHEALWSTTVEAITGVLRKSGVNPAQIGGICTTGHGDGLHLVAQDGKPSGPAITAVDSRAWREMEEIAEDSGRAQKILELSGQIPFLGSTGIIMSWVATHRPEWLDGEPTMLFCKDVINFRLTGARATDYSDASASFLNVQTGQWSSELLELYGLKGLENILPPVLRSSERVGEVSGDAARETGLTEGTPVIVGSHDVHAAAIGMGSLNSTMLTLIAGSFSINAVATDSPAVDPRWQSRLSLTPGLRLPMSTSATASTTLEWFLTMVGASTPDARDALFVRASEIDEGDSLPMLLPYVFASPIGQSPSGTFLGLRSWHTPAHLLRGVLEGIVMMHVWHCDALATAFDLPTKARLGGGLSRSGLYSQMVSDALGVTVETVDSDETGAYGAAALAALGTGQLDALTTALNRVQIRHSYSPRPDLADYWAKRKQLFWDSFSALDPLWKRWT